MAARMYTQFAQNKRSFPKPPASPSAGGSGKVVVKQSFTSQALPGKPSNWYKVGGGKVVDGTAARKG